MFTKKKYPFFASLILTSLLLNACGADPTPAPAQEINSIETAVAATVAAQNAALPTPEGPLATQTPLVFSPTLTPLAPLPTVTLTGNAPKSMCASASLVSENFPDGTIIKPGSKFTKTWEIKNTSPCTWDTSYKIIFWSGDIMGGAYYYNLPQVVAPNQTLPISLILTAPIAEATYKAEWMIQTPDSIEFGVGQYNAPFYAEVEVSAEATPKYTVTKVDFDIVRDPPTGCPANETYILTATLTTNGPVEVKYYWAQSDGNNSNAQTIKIESATTATISRSWKLHIATNAVTRWIALVILSPDEKAYPPVEFTKTCGG